MSAAADPAAVAGIGVGVVPKRRRGIEVRRRLFEAALDEFEAHGVEESRVERIVAAAETSWGTFFRYFPRKEDVLLLAAAEHFRERVRPIVEAGLEDSDRPVRDVAREAFAALTTPVRSPRLHAEILFESVRYPVRFAAMVDDGELPVILLFARLMVEGQRRGEVKPGIPPPICATVLAAGIVFSSAQVLRAVAAGEAPGSRIAQVAGLAFDAAWQGLEAPE